MKYPFRKNVFLLVVAVLFTFFSLRQIIGLGTLIEIWRNGFAQGFNFGLLINVVGTLVICATGPVLLWLILATAYKKLILTTVLLGLPYELLSLVGVAIYSRRYFGSLWPELVAPIVLSALALFALYRGSKYKPVEAPRPDSKATLLAPTSSLPTLSLIFSFFFPILGIIFGHVALGQIDRGQVTNLNRGLAKAGLVIGYIVLIITIVLAVGYLVAVSATVLR